MTDTLAKIARKQIDQEIPVREVSNTAEYGIWSGSTSLGEMIWLLYPSDGVTLNIAADAEGEGWIAYTGGSGEGKEDTENVTLTITATRRTVYCVNRVGGLYGYGHEFKNASDGDKYQLIAEGELAVAHIQVFGNYVVVSPV